MWPWLTWASFWVFGWLYWACGLAKQSQPYACSLARIERPNRWFDPSQARASSWLSFHHRLLSPRCFSFFPSSPCFSSFPVAADERGGVAVPCSGEELEHVLQHLLLRRPTSCPRRRCWRPLDLANGDSPRGTRGLEPPLRSASSSTLPGAGERRPLRLLSGGLNADEQLWLCLAVAALPRGGLCGC